jgi:prepilin-type N-terminal cleavage/methylation domain-containing protein
MLVRCKQFGGNEAREECAAFTLAEVLIAMVILAMVMAGLIYGYAQVNRIAEWSSMSLAAQSMASQGMEQARAAQWNAEAFPYTNGPGTTDELPPTNYTLSGSNYAMDVPATGTPFYATNIITISTVQSNPPLRMIRSDCSWTFPLTGKIFTNTVVTYRGPDQ